MKLTFINYRARKRVDDVTDDEVRVFYARSWLRGRKLTIAQRRAEMARIWDDELSPFEIVDVVDEDGEQRWVMYFSALGSALLLDPRTGEKIAGAAQHSIDTCPTRELWDALGEAYRTSKPRIRQKISFAVKDESRFVAHPRASHEPAPRARREPAPRRR